MARRALDLSQLGGNIVRALERQQVYVAEPIGGRVREGPVRRSAKQLLANHLGLDGVEAHSNQTDVD